jgi:spore maturation protein CgeB
VSFLGTPTPYRRAMLSRLHKAGIPLAIYGRHWRDNKPVVPDSGLEKTMSDIRNYAFARVRHEGFAGVAAPIRARLHRAPSVESADDVLGSLAHGAIDAAAMTPLFRNSEVNIGFTRMSGLEVSRHAVNQVKLRDFEVPLAGGFYLVEEAPDHAELYDIGREIVTWTSPEELVDRTHYYLAHPSERERIAAAGQQRAARDHTWEKRFRGLFERLGLK